MSISSVNINSLDVGTMVTNPRGRKKTAQIMRMKIQKHKEEI